MLSGSKRGWSWQIGTRGFCSVSEASSSCGVNRVIQLHLRPFQKGHACCSRMYELECDAPKGRELCLLVAFLSFSFPRKPFSDSGTCNCWSFTSVLGRAGVQELREKFEWTQCMKGLPVSLGAVCGWYWVDSRMFLLPLFLPDIRDLTDFWELTFPKEEMKSLAVCTHFELYQDWHWTWPCRSHAV